MVSPVHGPAHAAELAALVEQIAGVSGTTAAALDGTELRLTVHVGRPVALASELRRVLHRQLVSCTVRSGCLVVRLSGAPGGRAGDGHPPGWTPDLTIPATLRAVARPAPQRSPAPAPTAPPAPAAPAVPAVDVMFGALQAMTDVSIIVFDAELRIRAVTGTAHTGGLGPERLTGRRAPDALSDEEWRRFERAFADALAGETSVIEFDGPGASALYESTCSPVLHDATVVGGMVVTRDVTARRRDEMLVSELREVFELTFDDSPICQALLSPAGQWLRVNGALRALLRRDEASLAGRAAREITHPDDREEEQRLLDDLLAGGRRGYALQKRLLRADGGAVAVHLRMSAVRAEDGTVRGLIAQIVDADDVLTPVGPADGPTLGRG